MTRGDYEPVIDRMRMADGTRGRFRLPGCVGGRGRRPGAGAIRCPSGCRRVHAGILHVEDIWKYDREKEAEKVFGTDDPHHPGVEYLMNHKGACYIGGALEGIEPPLHYAYRQYRHTPD